MVPPTHRAQRRPAQDTGERIPRPRGEHEIPAPRRPEGDDDAPVSVGTLLRREGLRVPRAAERPLQPRAHQLRPVETSESWLDGVAMRRAGAAAGALVAAASVLGAAVLSDTGGPVGPAVDVPAAADPPGGGGVSSLPGLALLGPVPPGSVTLAAFESSASGGPAAILLPGGSAPGGAVPASGGLGGVVGGLVDGAGAGVSGATDALGATVQGTTSTLGRTVGGATDALGDAVGGPVGDVVKEAGGAVGGVVEGGGDVLGDVVAGAGDTVDGVTRTLTAPVTGLLGAALDDSTDDSTETRRRDPALSTLDRDEQQGDGLVQSVGRTASGLLGF